MINSTLIYIRKNGKTLLLHRIKKKNDLNEGKWIGVGGKFEEGETAEECVVREVFEETGLKLTKWHLHGVVKFFSNEWEDQDMYLFTGLDFEGEIITDCNEGDLVWVDDDKVLSMPTWEGDHFFMEPLMAGQDKINMLVSYEGDKLVKHEILDDNVVVERAKNFKYSHGFSTRRGGISEGVYESLNLGMNRGDIKERVVENWRRFLEEVGISRKEFVCGEQVHGNNVHIATKDDLRPAFGPGELVVADGYVTNEKNIPLSIFTADCVPLLLEDSENGVIGAIHCGWKSTVSDIEGEAIKKMISLSAKPDTIHAAIGPAIDICCFEVGAEVIEAVEKLLGGKYKKLYYIKENGKYMLDLRGVVRERLLQLGLKPENIEKVGTCTMCNPQKYWSHRYTNGVRGSLACIIEMN